MAFSKRIGLLIAHDRNYGIINYVINIINVLNASGAADKPSIVLYYVHDSLLEELAKIKYDNVRIYKISPYPVKGVFFLLNRLYNQITKRNSTIIFKLYLFWESIKITLLTDSIYPYGDFPHFRFVKRKIEWFIDLHYHFMPSNVSENELTMYFEWEKSMIDSKRDLVLSSEEMYRQFREAFPGYQNKIFVIPFATLLPKIGAGLLESTLTSYNISGPYFMTPNQISRYKNHMVILKAVKDLVEKGHKFQMLFTGNIIVNDKSPEKDYLIRLSDYIKENGLETYVKFLGIIKREQQLSLMQNAIALIQPSKYEGWSTLVEEAKSLNKYIILSDIAVHREQINKNVSFFNIDDHSALSEYMEMILTGHCKIENYDYDSEIITFKGKLFNLFKQ